MDRIGFICLAAAFTLWAAPVFAFGTVDGVGQNSEHERITRRALGCGGATFADCFEHDTLVQLAGEDRNFGAIGIPDRGDLIAENKAHCDSADYLDVPLYPQSREQARAALKACRDWMLRKLHAAVNDAGELVNANGRLRDSQLGLPCLYVGRMRGRAKCNVLEDFGILLHASQDFYSHSNWVDIADENAPIGADNPPGLGHSGRAQWLDLHRTQPFPDGLISGCFDRPPESQRCNYGPKDAFARVKHAVVNKDTGPIDPALGQGTTSRGGINGNFARAVEAAIDDTADKWQTLKDALAEAYGADAAATMVCAIRRDDPMSECD